MPDVRRGRCRKCRIRWRLRTDGTLQTHHLYSGHDRNPDSCQGSGLFPEPLQWHGSFPVCMECSERLTEMGPMLIEAIASVAIETGGDPHQMYRQFFEKYHANDHAESD